MACFLHSAGFPPRAARSADGSEYADLVYLRRARLGIPIKAEMIKYRILLVEDMPDDARRVEDAARLSAIPVFELVRVTTLAAALDRARAESFDVILSELNLPDSQGLDTVRMMQRGAPYCPMVVLTAAMNDTLAVDVLREGADDYLVKDEVSPSALLRAARHAIERRQAAQRAQAALEEETRVIQTLQRIGASLTAELDLQRVVQLVTDEATALVDAAWGAFFYNVTDADGAAYMLYTLSGAPRDAFKNFPLPRVTPLFEPIFSGKGIMRSDDVTQEPRYGQRPPHHGMPPGHLPVRSYLAAPVTSGTGEVIGGLFFGHPHARRFTERQEQIAGGLASWAAVAVDNARLYEAERRARAEAEKASRVKSEFLANMSHELRTPLNAMIGYSDLWLLGLPVPVPAEIHPQIQRVRRSAQHLLALIEEVLTFSRLEGGHERVQATRFSVQDEIETVITFIEPQALEKGLAFHTQIPSQPITMVSDARKLRQVLINLLSNAVKFTTAGEVRLTVEVRGGEIWFAVVDTGRGIPAQDTERIFEPFIQGGTEHQPRPEGTGLGLSVSRRLARMLGGDISVQSDLGRGSVFGLQLPLDAPPAPATD
jgi:signal transduction histidine kinase/DNA-binding response OmpR family regulator